MELLETFPPALLIALLALIATAWHGHATRRHQRLTLQPMLRFGWDFRRDEHKGITLVNKGAGPAILVSVDVWV